MESEPAHSPSDLTTRHARRAVEGDARSLHWLVERVSPLLHAVAARRLGARLSARYDPADVVQDVWTSVLPKLGTLDLRGPRTTPTVLKYLSTAVANRIRTLLERHLGRQLAGEPDDAGLEGVADPTRGVLTKAAQAESAGCVHRALEELSDADRQIVVLRGIEQESLQAVAEQLGIERGTAAVRFHRALKRLQQQLPNSVFADLQEVDE